MATFQYRALAASGAAVSGQIEAASHADAVGSLRKAGMRPIEIAEPKAGAARTKRGGKTPARLITNVFAELGVLLQAGLPLDRALAIAVENVEQPPLRARLADVLAAVREGKPLSAALSAHSDLFPGLAPAMTEAGEANGKLGEALARLAQMLEQADEQRRQIGSAMTYPIALGVIALGVILLMLLFVVPQFEGLFASAPPGKLPAASLFVMGASQFVRANGLIILAVLAGAGFAARTALARPGGAAWLDRTILDVPQIGVLVRNIETVRFARSLGALIEGGVPLPNALALARRTVTNGHMSAAIGEVTDIVRQGGGLAAPLAERRVLPTMALSFIRTGEETSQLGPMLARLSTVLDRDVKVRLERVIAVATPVIVVSLGVLVAAMVASIMSAILGFNDLAVAQ
ncbi:type II secretion system F family protein [Novosphingobium sp. PASSN1]|uniref:type II secretion system F family protein n=1 Tax=Novosphingobium sp. PASSN1 TaxID=2015561 RepID=UPI000BD09AB8|nr:type II secretion system F family protein [Novosphingobium sp. PASSN1]OYU36056.1 MAG: type II secretion system protein [Novosphingobium sp. PASSN1]